ncbi:MAG: DUF1553 domain-containing protein [Planctomycetes bacterium]|nr:DUF1553 domain-containing protein [Planctomycetota bacterium]
MHKTLPAIALFLAALTGRAAAESIDDAVSAALRERGIKAAGPCNDETFVRRVFLDVIGKLPEPEDVRNFVNDTKPDKRAALIDALLVRPEFADYWSMKWCDLLRVKSEFPINLWPNAVQAYHRWIHDALRTNRPYDEVARELLTSSGSNFRVPPVNFYRAVQGRAPADLAAAAALTFMGARLDRMPKDRAANLAVFFSRVGYKPTSEWKEEIVLLNPAPVEAVQATLPDGTAVALGPGDDPRRVFADWLITVENPWFARAVANRVWAWLLGRGIVNEPDDLREDNPPSNPALLAVLARELAGADWDLRHLYRIILNSRAWQASSVPASDHPEAGILFAHALVRRLDAEVIVDALGGILNAHEEYSSPIPEPYTFIPTEHPCVLLPDGSITSSLLEMFGRPARDTGLFSERNNECTDAQRLFLLNSSVVQTKLQTSPKLRRLMEGVRGDVPRFVGDLYLLILARTPTQEEVKAARAYMKTPGLNPKQAADDLAWALLNTKEFLFRH